MKNALLQSGEISTALGGLLAGRRPSRRKLAGLALLCGLGVAATASRSLAQSDDASYRFADGEQAVYEITVKSEYPGTIKTQIGHLALYPKATDSNGVTKLRVKWGIKVLRTQTSYNTSNAGFAGQSKVFDPAASGNATRITIDSRGAITDNEGELNGAQLEGAQGSAWKLIFQPLPPAGKTTWEVKAPISLYTPQTGPGGFVVAGVKPKSQIPGELTATYTAAPPQDGVLTVQRKFDMRAGEKNSAMPTEHMHGDGEYVFDLKAGRIKKLHWSLVDDVNSDAGSASVPITVDARLMPADEVAKIKQDLAARDAETEQNQKVQEEAEAMFDGGQRIERIGDLPPGMQTTDVLGTQRGGDFADASGDRKPVIGFRVTTGEWFGKIALREFRPIYQRLKEKGKPDRNVLSLVAREGYAVGSITVNADKDGVHALCVTFMKMTDNKLDTKQFYTSPWMGKKVGTAQKKLTGNGSLVYGICGRKGLNIDAIGLVTEGAPADDSDKP